MAEERYQAKEKVTQKMTRDGLVTQKGKPTEEVPENPGLKKRQKVPERFRDPVTEDPAPPRRDHPAVWIRQRRCLSDRWAPGGIFRLVPGIAAEKDPTIFRAASGVPRDVEGCSFCFFGKVR